ncbi:hypothetical protein K443DRAFT_672919 [Laccaria amethystina LaAM-08-1]|uniref:Unplaced genomic scaffold K443scaffold_9, whole genome shotgun sequence n=1 Tax=Laccaria amethystina LaAM-08-1 TaxID=1095629 RepID=A0A0C9XSY0_9AGAR|nr:hypothetical protein K443DRAFT_672919 [Laccaria amethystina LaAM-08-1]
MIYLVIALLTVLNLVGVCALQVILCAINGQASGRSIAMQRLQPRGTNHLTEQKTLFLFNRILAV